MIQELIAELTRDLEAWKALGREVEECLRALRASPGNAMLVDALAARLHRLYGCAEDMAYRVSVHINGEVPAGPQAHKDLLDRTALEVPGKRQALWARASLEELHELRKFRHFFRAHYAVRLDPEKVIAAAERALRAIPQVEGDVRRFLSGLSGS